MTRRKKKPGESDNNNIVINIINIITTWRIAVHVRKSITGSKSCIDTVAAMTYLLDSVGCFLVSFIITLPYDSSHVPPMLFPILSRQPSTPTNARETDKRKDWTGLFFKQNKWPRS